MKFYTQEHRYTCGIDLHARSLYVCILDNTGKSTFINKFRSHRSAVKVYCRLPG
jgi:ribosome biogenesis GTPase A